MVTDLSTLLTVHEAARRAEYVSESALRARIYRGELPVIRLGRGTFIERDVLDAWLKTRGVKG